MERTDQQERVFNAKSYLNNRYLESSPRFPLCVSGVRPFIEYFDKFCKSFQDINNGSAVTTALDLGSGPSVNLSLLMHRYMSRIVIAEYEQTNLDELLLWKSNSPQAFDWTPYLRAVFKEHGGIPQGVDPDTYISRTIEDTRQKVSTIARCDLRKDPIIDPAAVPEGGFDFVASSHCLSIAATNMDDFYQVFKSVRSVMKDGALLVGCLTGRSTWYCEDPRFPETKLPVLYVTEDDIKQAVKEAQMELVETNIQPNTSITSVTDAEEVQFFACRR